MSAVRDQVQLWNNHSDHFDHWLNSALGAIVEAVETLQATAANREASTPESPLFTFWYTNWHGDRYEYVIRPDGKMEYHDQGPGPHGWVVSGDVVTRRAPLGDPDPRSEMGPTRRRSFLISQIRCEGSA